MSRKQWSFDDRIKIWVNYEQRIRKSDNHVYKYLDRCERTQLPCPICYLPMDKDRMLIGILKGNENPNFWNVDHINGNHNDNHIYNLQPAHVHCNAKKGNVPMSHIKELRDDEEKGEYLMTPKEYKDLVNLIKNQNDRINKLTDAINKVVIKKHWWTRRRKLIKC